MYLSSVGCGGYANNDPIAPLGLPSYNVRACYTSPNTRPSTAGTFTFTTSTAFVCYA